MPDPRPAPDDEPDSAPAEPGEGTEDDSPGTPDADPDDDEDPDEGLGHAEATPLGPRGTPAPSPGVLDWLMPTSLRDTWVCTVAPLGLVLVSLVGSGALHATVEHPGGRVLLSMLVLVVGLSLTTRGPGLTRHYIVTVPPGGYLRDAGVSRRGLAAGLLVPLLMTAVWLAGIWRGPDDPAVYVLAAALGNLVLFHCLTRCSLARLDLEEWYEAEKARAAGAKAITQRWGARLGAPAAKGRKTGPLAGSKLSAIEVMPDGGFRSMVTFPPDSDATWRTLEANRAGIANAFRADESLVFIGRHRAGGPRATLVVHQEDPLAVPERWPGPSITRHGRYRVGTYADGEPIWAKLWQGTDGTPHGFVVGATRAGKSGYVKIKVRNAIASGRFVVLYLDGKGGASIPEFSKAGRVHYFAATPDAILRGLRAAIAVLEVAQAQQMVDRAPTSRFPGVLLVVDDFPQVAIDVPESVKLMDQLGRLGAGFNMSVTPTAQSGTVDGFGAPAATRSNFTAGDVAMFRTTDKGAKSVLQGSVLDGIENRVPQGRPGLGYIPGEAETTMWGRTYDARSPWAPPGPLTWFEPKRQAAWEASLSGGRVVQAEVVPRKRPVTRTDADALA